MQTFVYKSERRQQCFVYLSKADAFEKIPEPIRKNLGTLSLVLEFNIAERTRLAQEDINVVRRNLADCGYHLQFPPPEDKQFSDDD